jgi:hypothetical protein
MQFTVGLKLKGKLDRIVLDAEDAPTAALKVMAEHSEAIIRYVRPQNRRGVARHPSQRFCPISQVCQEIAGLSDQLPEAILSVL